APRRSTVIRLRIPERRSIRLTPPAPVPNVDKADEMILQDSLAEHKSREEREARENVALVDEHLVYEEIKKMVDGQENVVDDSSIHRNDESNIPGNRIEPKSNKESLKVEITKDKEVGITKDKEVKITKETPVVDITNVVILVNVNDEDEEITDEVYELKRREKGKNVEETTFQEEQAPSTLGNQEQDDDFDFWTDSYATDNDETPTKQVSQDIMEEVIDSYATDDDEILTKQVSQDIMEEVSLTIDEAKLRKMADEMLRQRCTSGDEHQYQIDQMKNFLKNPEAPSLSLINQDLLYLKKGNSGPKKIVLSLHKFLAVIFNDDDIEERTSRWVNKCVKKFNPYARFAVEHWKKPHAKIFYIRKQKETKKSKEVIVARRANESIMSITESDFKNLNKNDIEDMYLLIMNDKVTDYTETGLLWSLSLFIRSSVIWEIVHDFQLGVESYQQKVNLTAPIISFPGIKKYKMFSIIHEPVYGIIYKNSKKEKKVTRHSEIHKFCDATLNRVLKGLKSYNNDVKYGYIQRELTKEDIEYLQLFEEEIDERLKHRNQMRRTTIKM
ncbi:hypothetical protein Tco_0475069, partial [Tanacetum coccineum]